MPTCNLPHGYVYAYAEGNDAIKTSFRVKEVKDESTAMVSSILDVIVISKHLKRYSKAKRTRAPAYSRALDRR